MNGYSTYSRTQSNTETLRESEAQALLRVASKLELAQGEGVGYFDYCDAVRQNQKLWTIFQASLADPETNKLPVDLTETLKGLSIYIDRRSLRAIGEFDKSLLRVLIDINKQIAMGLMQRAENEATTVMAQQAPQTPPPAGSGLNIAG